MGGIWSRNDIDGKYQCNRNRCNLKVPGKGISPEETEIDFVVRQKEDFLSDGTISGRPWSFEKLPTLSQSTEGDRSREVDEEFTNLGKLEVIVLRCYPSSNITEIETQSRLLTVPSADHAAQRQRKLVHFALGSKEALEMDPKFGSNVSGLEPLNQAADGVALGNDMSPSTTSNEGGQFAANGKIANLSNSQNSEWERSSEDLCGDTRATSFQDTAPLHQSSPGSESWQGREYVSTTPFFTYPRPVLPEDTLAQPLQGQGPGKVAARSDEEIADPTTQSGDQGIAFSEKTGTEAGMNRRMNHLMPYWAEWDQRKSPNMVSADSGSQPFSQHIKEKLVLPSLLKDVADSTILSHYVQTGEANPYTHNLATPEYMDTFENPYAVFVFRYASDAMLAAVLHVAPEEISDAENDQYKATPEVEISHNSLQAQQDTSWINQPIEGVHESQCGEGQCSRQYPNTSPNEEPLANMVLETSDVHSRGIDNLSSSSWIGEQGHLGGTGTPRSREHSNSSTTYFQVTTWLTSLRQSTWMSNTGPRTTHETLEQLIDQRTAHATVNPMDNSGSPRFINTFTSHVHLPTWLPSFRRSSWVQDDGNFTVIGGPPEEASPPVITGSWNSLYSEGSGDPGGSRISVESVHGELSESLHMETEGLRRMSGILDTPTEGVITNVQGSSPFDDQIEEGPSSDRNTVKLDIDYVRRNNGFNSQNDSHIDFQSSVNEMPGAWHSEDEASRDI